MGPPFGNEQNALSGRRNLTGNEDASPWKGHVATVKFPNISQVLAFYRQMHSFVWTETNSHIVEERRRHRVTDAVNRLPEKSVVVMKSIRQRYARERELTARIDLPSWSVGQVVPEVEAVVERGFVARVLPRYAEIAGKPECGCEGTGYFHPANLCLPHVEGLHAVVHRPECDHVGNLALKENHLCGGMPKATVFAGRVCDKTYVAIFASFGNQ